MLTKLTNISPQLNLSVEIFHIRAKVLLKSILNICATKICADLLRYRRSNYHVTNKYENATVVKILLLRIRELNEISIHYKNSTIHRWFRVLLFVFQLFQLFSNFIGNILTRNKNRNHHIKGNLKLQDTTYAVVSSSLNLPLI